jgi:hypothetical protein
MEPLGLNVDLWLKIASLTGTFIAYLIARRRRPRLEAFFTHGAGHQIVPPGGQPVGLNTHSLVVRNAGAASAPNVRVTHGFFPAHTDVQIWPAQPHSKTAVQPHGLEILFDRLRPQEQLSLSYLYPAGTTFDQFQTYVRFDEGMAYFFPIQHVRIIPRWLRVILYYLMIAGLTLTLYIVFKAALYLFILT